MFTPYFCTAKTSPKIASLVQLYQLFQLLKLDELDKLDKLDKPSCFPSKNTLKSL